ncbi:hypothetical protein [Streptomyces sp. NPDC049040]|uniref:hypothetical protein n=1 Tax=Streptomyces sp. NPDC049040 TaxID=3365593 RepID=UPI003717F53B
MPTTKPLLERAWREAVAGSGLIDDAMLPPIRTSGDQYAQLAWDPRGMVLVLDEDGTVHGRRGPHREVFATQDLDEVLYFAAEEAVRDLAGQVAARSAGHGPATDLVAAQAEMLDRISPAWGSRFRGGGPKGAKAAPPCGRDPLENLAWIAGAWREQDPYTNLEFFRGEGVSAERVALLHGADPGQVAAGTSLSDLREMDHGGRDAWDVQWESFCFGQAGDWVFLMYHETPPGVRPDEALSRLGVTEAVRLSACAAKGIHTFGYTRDGRRVDDGWGVLELMRYERGRAPYRRGGQLDFLNQALRRAELDHPELTDGFELYFHALEIAFGLRLPHRDIEEERVRAAQWARGNPVLG